MDRHQHTLSAGSSSSSAIDLTGTPSGIGGSVPPSPALLPSDSTGSFTRRRASWSRTDVTMDPTQDPLRFDLADSDPRTSTPQRTVQAPGWTMHEDPFFSPREEDSPPLVHEFGTYSTAQPGPSSASLIPSTYRGNEPDGYREDDEAALTRNMARQGSDMDIDPERSAATTASARSRRTLRYSTSPSPLRKTGNRLLTLSRNIRRVSLRVVNMAGMGLDEHVRLADEEDEKQKAEDEDEEFEDEEQEEALPDLSKTLPIRGRTLGFLGPTSKVRLAMYRFLVYKWTEPVILLSIIFNAVILTIQAARGVALPADGSGAPPQIQGYFHQWEDHALFILFIFFTVEMFARISVTGFLLDPEVPTSTLFASPFTSTEPPFPSSTSGEGSATLTRQASLLTSASTPQVPTLSRGGTLTERLRRFRYNLSRPFVLHHASSVSRRSQASTQRRNRSSSRPRSDTTQSTTPMMEKAQQFHQHFRNSSKPTFLSNALKSDNEKLSLPFRLSIERSNETTDRNLPYLRHSWTRIDFVAVVGFWISFALSMAGVERGTYHIGIFRALSVLRTARLLAITSGTTTIMRSLKTARPLLAGVAYFVLFAMILFSIIGIQSFKGSFRRSCHLLPTLGQPEIPLSSGQSCGAYVDQDTLEIVGWLANDNVTHAAVKGYVCPLGQICREDPGNPYGDIESFDTIYFSALQVFIVASANGWSPVMYSMMDSEFFISCFFFIVCIVVLNFWLINLFVAVITNTFTAIRKDTHKSAFGAAPLAPVIQESEEGWSLVDGRRIAKSNRIKDLYESIRWCWVALALASLVLQATRNVDVGPTHQAILNEGELILTIVFDIEIFIRILAYLPDWRGFLARGQNWLDMTLAVGSSIIQIPIIHNSSIYPWLTIFQLTRFYRVILEIPRMKPLLLAVFGNMYGLANMTLFLLLINYITALVGIQLLRGDVPSQDGQLVDWGEIFNAFLGIYQVFSSENWTDVLYGSAQPEIPLRQSALVVLFISGWMFFANFIVLQMFIAVINENFDVAEEHKRSRQASHFIAAQRPEKARAPWIRRMNPYRWFRAKPKAIAVDQLPSNLVLPMQKALVQDYSFPRMDTQRNAQSAGVKSGGPRHISQRSLNLLQNLFSGKSAESDVPMTTFRGVRRESVSQDPADEDNERHLELLAALNPETTTAEDMNDILYERRAQKADFIRDHPTYDKTFWIFSQKNPIRRLCQKLVTPANGERIFGTPPSPIVHPIFQLILFLTVVSGIVVEWIATPLYRRTYYLDHGFIRGSWFDIAETAFGFTLFVEFVIKIIADGFVFTPNAYIRSIWNILDFFIMLGIIVNITTGLVFIGGLSRVTRSLKALRALRLITLIDKMRSTFENLIISGAARIFDAALLAILYMIPYAVWGTNIFAGLMNECNDGSVNGIGDCINEYGNNVVGNSFTYYVPRAWDNPAPSTTFSFDSFRASLLILFEIVSLEGWVDVMTVAVSITGKGQQPNQNVSQANAIFFLIYNLLGGVVILTLFISIIIGNFTSRTGSALLTQPQREWIDLQKLIKRQRPSRRPKVRPAWAFRAWCYDRAVHKHGWWYRTMTALFILHVIALMTQTFAPQHAFDDLRNDFFLFLTIVYLVDIAVRLYGLGWGSYSANGWNLFDIIVAGGSLITILVVRFNTGGFAVQQLQKLFITSMAFKLVQRTNSLNKLFKTAVASLPVILSLLALWLVLFLFFGILYVEVFSMTKWNSAETRNGNYSTMPKALVMLAFMTTGEGWNQYMHDFALEYPRCTNSSGANTDSDCGSEGWSFTLFIAWNLLSMYIFANLFTGVVVESFYYVFQMTGGAKEITREEMRSFKKTWAEYANPKTGYLERDKFVKFFGKLSGVFEVRIYPPEYNIPQLLSRSLKDGSRHPATAPVHDEDIDRAKLQAILNCIDRSVIKRRKNLYNRLYHEAQMSAEPGRGISFTNMLLLLAHHKLIDDKEALVLQDLVARTDTNKLVTDLVDVDRVQSLLLMISHRRRFLRMREQARMQKLFQHGVPNIVVSGGEPSTPPSLHTSRDITSPSQDTISRYMDAESPVGYYPNNPQDFSASLETPSRSTLQRSRRLSDMSMLSSADAAARSSFETRSSTEGRTDDPDTILNAMQSSMWGEMLVQAAEEEV
ncbi:hypothetical protein NM688_g1042 [Phlebia brevispora]|uniref:Uncharacterized protein n=1 Tax=Phlebia brevispora TaxID=194682 RepID=A0ACC1TCT9_9APHY|nr:hypothetical protein NM688_g1042 [Phlebia brevispora]